MKGSHIGEFEEIVLLTVAILNSNAYGISIRHEIAKQLKRKPSIGALHSALGRLEQKGFISSSEGEETPERGGRRKRYYIITAAGLRAIKHARELRNAMWKSIPSVVLDLQKP